MSSYYFEQVFTKPNTSVLWPEEHFLSIGETHKHERLLDMYSQRDQLLNVNSTWSSTQTDTERRVYVQFTEAEYFNHMEALNNQTGPGIVDGTGMTVEDNAILREVSIYLLQSGIFLKSGYVEVDANGTEYQLTLETTDTAAQNAFYDEHGLCGADDQFPTLP